MASPSLSTDLCSVCSEHKTYFGVTACSKPLTANGHEPSVCFNCWQQTFDHSRAATAVCILCRQPVHVVHRINVYELLQEPWPQVLHCNYRLVVLQPTGSAFLDFTCVQVDNDSIYIDAAPNQDPNQNQEQEQEQRVVRRGRRRRRTRRSRAPQQQQQHVNQATSASRRMRNYQIATQQAQWRCYMTIQHFLQQPQWVNNDGACISCQFPIGLHLVT